MKNRSQRGKFHGSQRSRAEQHRLDQLESEFTTLLLPVLKECAAGRWGLFGQNDSLDQPNKYFWWTDAQQVKELAREIHALCEEFGQPNPLVERYLHLCSLRGANVPGEPKLARALLDEISRSAGPDLSG